jgi:hypothetical protein
MFPGEVTRVIARFDRPGEYVWHCHILAHEDRDDAALRRRLSMGSPRGPAGTDAARSSFDIGGLPG